MSRYQKSDAERKYERMVELSREWLSVTGSTNEILEKQKKILTQMEATDSSIIKKKRLTISDMEAINETYAKQLEYEKAIRIEKENQYNLEEKRKKATEEYTKKLAQFNDYQRNLATRNKSNKRLELEQNLGIAEDIKDRVSYNVIAKYSRQGIADKAHYKDIQREIMERTNSNLNAIGMDKTYEQLKFAAEKIDVAAETWKEVGTQFKNILGNVFKLFDEGIDRQVQIYEDTFHDISARTGMSRDDYFDFQLDTMNRLFDEGLQYSIGVSDNQNMLKSLSDIGMSDTEATARAFDNVVTQKILPYLETTSQAFNLLNSRVNGKFVEEIRGINAYSQDIAGNNYLTKELLDKMIDLVQPMSDESIQNLAKSSANYITAMNYLMSKEGGNLSYEQAMDVYNTIYKSQNYASQMMRGSTFEKLFQVGIQEKNIDLEDLSQLPLGIGNYFGTGERLNIGPGYGGSAENNLLQNTIGESLGLSRSQSYAINKFLGAGNTEGTFNKMFTETTTNLQDYTEGEFTRLINNETTTASQMQKYLTENVSTPLATLKAEVGKFGDGILDALKSITLTLIGSGLSNTIASALGIKGVPEGFKKFFASGGGVALGSLTVAAIPLLATSISRGIADSKKNKAVANADSYKNELTGVEGIGDMDSAAAIHAYTDQLTASNKGLGAKIGNVLQAFGQGINIGDKLQLLGGTDPVAVNKAIWNEATAGTFLDEKTLEYMVVAFANSMLAAGNSASIIPQVLGSGINVNGIKTEAHYLYNQDPNNFLNNLITAGNNLIYTAKGPKGQSGKSYKFSYEDMQNWGTFRQGLSKVPYDEYPALLHAGETIMTASTTATMENMVQAFRESQNQNYRIDAAIQEQTAQLVAKIDEVINAIGSAGSNPTNFNSPSEKLRNSLRTLTSPLAFQG